MDEAQAYEFICNLNALSTLHYVALHMNSAEDAEVLALRLEGCEGELWTIVKDKEVTVFFDERSYDLIAA